MDRRRNVLFLCTHNSARSLIAEVLLNNIAGDRFRAFSAGSHPSGAPNPLVVEFLRSQGLPTEQLRSKSWDEFAAPDAPSLDFVITVCDQAAGEMCPVWPGRPITAHWGVPDPSAVINDAELSRRVVREVTQTLERRIQLFVSLPIGSLDRLAMESQMKRVGQAR